MIVSRGLGDGTTTAAAATDNRDWFERDVLPVLTGAINAGASVIKTIATPANANYALTPAGVSPLAFSAMTPAQQAAYAASLQQNPFTAELKSMMPMIALSGLGLVAFMMLNKRR